MRRLFEVLSIFDWVTPSIELAHQIKETPKMLRGESNEFHLFVKSKDYPQALAELQRIGIRPIRKPVGLGIVGEWNVTVPYDKLNIVMSAFNQAGVRYRYK